MVLQALAVGWRLDFNRLFFEFNFIFINMGLSIFRIFILHAESVECLRIDQAPVVEIAIVLDQVFRQEKLVFVLLFCRGKGEIGTNHLLSCL
jgi:hypothetical protein